MISYEDCIDYIENKRESITWQDKYFAKPYLPMNGTGNIKLLDCQKKFLKNLIDGKITDCPRNLGKTMIIKLYAEYLNYTVDICKYDSSIEVDDYISGKELILNGLLRQKRIREFFKDNPEKAKQEYNIELSDLDDIGFIKMTEKEFLESEGRRLK